MTGIEARRAVLGADYWRLWTSSGLSNLADGILKVGLPLGSTGAARWWARTSSVEHCSAHSH